MPEMMCERCEREPVDCHAYDIRGRTRWLCADCARKLGVADFFTSKTGGVRGGGRTEKRVTHNPEHVVHERLKKAIREKHGPWAEEADRLFKRLRALRKDLTDAQIMDIVRAEMKKVSQKH